MKANIISVLLLLFFCSNIINEDYWRHDEIFLGKWRYDYNLNFGTYTYFEFTDTNYRGITWLYRPSPSYAEYYEGIWYNNNSTLQLIERRRGSVRPFVGIDSIDWPSLTLHLRFDTFITAYSIISEDSLLMARDDFFGWENNRIFIKYDKLEETP